MGDGMLHSSDSCATPEQKKAAAEVLRKMDEERGRRLAGEALKHAEADAAALREALNTILGCMDAAEVEGWSEAICNIHEDWARERIVDVWTRRISCVREEAEAALNTNAGKALLERMAELEAVNNAYKIARGYILRVAKHGPRSARNAAENVLRDMGKKLTVDAALEAK